MTIKNLIRLFAFSCLIFASSCTHSMSEKDKEHADSLAAVATADSLLKSATDTVSTDSVTQDHTAVDSTKTKK